MNQPPDSRRVLVVGAIAVAATLLFAWATWAIFLAPRSGGDTLENSLLAAAEELRDGDFGAVRDRLDPAFTLEPGGLDREAALAWAQGEFSAERFFPYVAHAHLIPGGGGDVTHVAVIGVLAQGNPEKMRNVRLVPVRLELKVRETGGRFVVLSARSHLGK